MTDIYQQCQLFENVRDRINRMFMADDGTFERLGERTWGKLVLAEMDWLGFLVTERVLPAKLVERSFGREALGLIETFRELIAESVVEDSHAYENLRQWEKQLIASSVKPANLKVEVVHD